MSRTTRAETATPRKLTTLQALFVEAYLGVSAGNGTDAARRAGYKGRPNALAVTASRLLTYANVRVEIERRRAQIARVMQIDTQWCMDQTRKRFEHCIKPLPTADGSEGEVARDETNGRQYLDMVNRMTGAYAEDNRQRQDQIAIVLR